MGEARKDVDMKWSDFSAWFPGGKKSGDPPVKQCSECHAAEGRGQAVTWTDEQGQTWRTFHGPRCSKYPGGGANGQPGEQSGSA